MKIRDPRYLETATKNHSGKKKKKLDAANRIDDAIKSILEEFELNNERRSAFLRLLTCVRHRTKLLRPNRERGDATCAGPLFYLRRLANIALRHGFWLRPCETWEPEVHLESQNEAEGGRRIFRSLLRHMLTKFAVPGFMESTWDCEPGPEGFRQQAWYIRLGRGAAFRSLNLPVQLTRRMEHHTRQAPDHYTVLQALRYGEILGMGGSKALAQTVVAGRLGTETEHGPFWRTVLLHLVNNAEWDGTMATSLIEFIHSVKFTGEDVCTINGIETRSLPWRDFEIEGRTSKSLFRAMSERGWEPEKVPGKTQSWERSDLKPYEYVERGPEGEQFSWRVVELLNSAALRAESGEMHHCVHSYTEKCMTRVSSIWSLRLRTANKEKRLVTIEVNPRTRRVVQIKGRWNRKPGVHGREILEEWFAREGLRHSQD